MSSLGAKVKELVRGGPHSKEAERGEVDRRTPGSFPTDDIATPPATKDTTTSQLDDAAMTSTSDDRNRLHKRGDPRGENPAHQHKDSAVGLDNNPHRLSQDPAQAQPTQQPREGDLKQRQQPILATSGGTGATAPTAEPDVTNAPTSREQAAAMSQPAGATGVQTTDSHHDTGKHGEGDHNTPYWGDMPRGAGVYNGVTGHGSAEDPHRTGQEGAGVYNGVTGRGSNEDQNRTGHEGATGTSQTHAASRNPVTEATGTTQQRAFPLQSSSDARTQQPHGTDAQDTRDSRFKEGLAGTGAAAGAGAAAYGLSQRNREDHPGQQTSEQWRSGQDAPTQTQEQKGGLAGLFHSGSREDKEAKEQRHQAEKREKEMKKEQEHHEKELRKEQERVQHQHEKDEKKRQELIEKNNAKAHKESGGFFSHHGKEAETRPEVQQQQPADNKATAAQSRDPRYEQAGLATAAATTAYAAHEGQQRHQGTHPAETAHDEKPKESHGLGSIFGLGKKKSNEHSQNEPQVAHRTAQPTSQAAAGSTANYGSHPQPRDETHVPIGTRSSEQAPGADSGHDDRHSGYGTAAGAAALGAGAGYGASRLAGDHRDHPQTTSTSHQQQPATASGLNTQTQHAPTSHQSTTSRGLESSTRPTQGSGLGQTATAAGVGAGVGHGASRLAGQHGHQDTSAAGLDNRMQQTYGGSGHYDTPQPGAAAQTSTAGQSYPGGPEYHSGHSPAKAALAGATAGGAGTAAYQHATRDSSHPQSGSQGLHQGSSTAGTTGGHSSAEGFTAPQTHARTSHGDTTATGSTGRSEPEVQKVEYNYLPDGTPSGIKVSSSPRASGAQSTSTGDNSLASGTHKGVSQASHDGHHSGTAAALGAAGAGGAGYLAHDHHEKEKAKQREQTAVSNMPQGTSGQTQPAVGDRGLTHSDDRHRTTTTGDSGHHHHSHHDKEDLQTRQTREQAAVSQMPQGASGQSQPALRDTNAPHNSQRDNRDLLAATVGVGAGAGAGAAAYNAHDRHQREKDQAGSYNTQPAHGSSTQGATGSSHPSHGGAYNTLPSGTESGVAQGANQVPTHGSSDLSSQSQNRSAAGHGNQGYGGAYNTLPSGTDSGVAQNTSQGSNLVQPTSNISQSSQTQPGQYDSHSSAYKTAGAAGAGAAAGGLGAAIMGSRDNDSDRLRQEQSQYSQQPGAFDQSKSRLADPTHRSTGDRSGHSQHFGGVASAIKDVAEGRSVTHDCSSCGHSDDISRYFKN